MIFIKLLILLPYIIFLNFLERKTKKLRFYGITGFFGLAGKGKTIAMTYELLQLRKKYKDKIYIMTNYNFKYEDFELVSWKQLLDVYDKPLIVAWDELPNEFNSRSYKDFPVSLITLLTQQRKGNGVKIYYTAQRYSMVDKNFRILSNTCIECSTILNYYTACKVYDTMDYDDLLNKKDVNMKMKIKPKYKYSFLQNNYIRNAYDSFKMLETAKTKEYLSRDEISRIEQTN